MLHKIVKKVKFVNFECGGKEVIYHWRLQWRRKDNLNLSQMSNKEKDLLKEKIKKAIQLSFQKLIEKKKSLGQSLVISKDGEIKVIKP